MTTVVLHNCPGDSPAEIDDWRRRFATLDPTIEFRAWPETGPVGEIDFILAWMTEPGDLKRYSNAKAIFWLGAGVDHLLKDKDLPRHAPIVRLVDPGLTAGMSEYVLLHVLRYHRRLPEQEALQRECRWRKLEYPLAKDRKVGVMGLGVLGGDAVAKLVPLGFEVAGWSRSPKQLPPIATFHGDSGLPAFLKQTEILICLLPLTPATAGIINRRTLALLPRGACVINAARGGHVVDSDLIAALDSGHIAHATLDVFETEPLPVEHPFWRHPRITVTPHVASVTIAETALRVIHDGIKAAQAGGPLKNMVDLAKGY
ncbi:MAG: 2-hydroxyacid dehydrogenase [Dongiaceae bacterium]